MATELNDIVPQNTALKKYTIAGMTIIRAKLQTTDFLFLCRSSLLLSEICQNIHMKFDAQIAANGVSGSIYFKNFPGGMPPDPPSRSHAFGARLHDHSHDADFATDRDSLSRLSICGGEF